MERENMSYNTKWKSWKLYDIQVKKYMNDLKI